MTGTRGPLSRVPQNRVVAALALERHAIAGGEGQRLGMRAGADDGRVASDGSLISLDRAEPARLDRQPGRPDTEPLGAVAHGLRRQSGHVSAGVAAMPGVFDQHCEAVAAVQRRFALA